MDESDKSLYRLFKVEEPPAEVEFFYGHTSNKGKPWASPLFITIRDDEVMMIGIYDRQRDTLFVMPDITDERKKWLTDMVQAKTVTPYPG